MAVSEDGLHFQTMPEPVLYPEKDEFSIYEWEGGCEDPRIVETKDGKYFLYYTSFNGKVALQKVPILYTGKNTDRFLKIR